MEMVAAMQQRQEGSMTETETQVKGRVEERTGTDALTSSEGPTLQEQSAVQVTQPSVIQAPQIQTTQSVATEAERVVVSDTQKRRELLSRRPSYRKILNELSSDTPAVPKIEEEDNLEDEALSSSSVSTVTVPSSIYQTTSGQYIAISQGGAVQMGPSGAEGLRGALTLPSATAPQPGATMLQFAPQTGDPAQQLLVSAGHVLVQAATGDMPAYQIRSPSSGLPQGVVMAASPGAIHSPQQQAEEATRKREVRLMKNREAARECRRKKKEYVKCLENRVAVLENQNKTLIEELKALKDIYCHKPE
ncbi:cAMP-responsive element modulator isoform X1 [Brachyhypopomus gauderio]|uniref:cAMP-responsive element modulator isoform X1 n=1 Tax=Brachyhypopomus gauderio TaxID=698409 RepID=UPI004040F47D